MHIYKQVVPAKASAKGAGGLAQKINVCMSVQTFFIDEVSMQSTSYSFYQ